MRRRFGRAPLLLGRGWVPSATILLALLLVSPSLGVGSLGDDYVHLARVDPRLHVPGFAYAPFDLFTIVSGDPSQRAVLLEEGVFGWWMAPDFRMSFWRPLSSLTNVLDQWLWPRSSLLAHAHSQRQMLGGPRPRRMRLLATCFARLRVSRLDATTLRVRPEKGFLDNGLLRMVRGLSRPFRPGDEVVLSDLRVRVREVTADGRPAKVDFAFAVPLEDESLLWTRPQAGGALVPWSPPALGESQLLPSVSPRQP